MGLIIWNAYVNAPGCPGEIIDKESGKSILIQCDYDYPDCKISASTFISAAYDFLCDNDGAEIDDPGYFREDCS